MPRGSKVAKVESKLKREYGSSKNAKRKIYGTLNKVGLMHGNKPTAKGLQPARKARTPKKRVKRRRKAGRGR